MFHGKKINLISHGNLHISSARCEQVKKKVVFDYAEHDLQHGGGNGFSLCWT